MDVTSQRVYPPFALVGVLLNVLTTFCALRNFATDLGPGVPTSVVASAQSSGVPTSTGNLVDVD